METISGPQGSKSAAKKELSSPAAVYNASCATVITAITSAPQEKNIIRTTGEILPESGSTGSNRLKQAQTWPKSRRNALLTRPHASRVYLRRCPCTLLPGPGAIVVDGITNNNS